MVALLTSSFTLPQGSNFPVGPGAPIRLQTDHPIVPPDNAIWRVILNVATNINNQFWVEQFPVSGSSQIINLGTGTKQQPTTPLDYPTEEQGIQFQLELIINGIVAEVATRQNAIWAGSNYSGELLRLQQTSDQGFTAEDRALLQQVETSTQVLGQPQDLVVRHASGPQQVSIAQLLSRDALDNLTLSEVTRGEEFGPIRALFKGWYFGVIVRVTTIAPDLEPKTPDGQWYFPDLAVLRLFRGSDLQYRRGIHTPTFMAEHPWEYGSQFLNISPVLGVPPDMTIEVDWRAGCGGRVFLQTFP